jgi:hypothetical protein
LEQGTALRVPVGLQAKDDLLEGEHGVGWRNGRARLKKRTEGPATTEPGATG